MTTFAKPDTTSTTCTTEITQQLTFGPLWKAPTWATYMDLYAPEGSDRTGFQFSNQHGGLSYHRDFDGGHFSLETEFLMDVESLEVSAAVGQVEVHLSAGLGDNEYVFTIDECRDTLAGFDQAPPVLRPLVELHAALRAAVEIADASNMR